jgi:hypothetical protein
MKKRFALAAVAVALAGAAVVPAGSAFGKTKKPPGPVALAVHCAILQSLDDSYDASIAAPLIDPTTKSILQALEASNDARATALCGSTVFPDPT